MYVFSGAPFTSRSTQTARIAFPAFAVLLACWAPTFGFGQDAGSVKADAAAKKAKYTPAIQILPDTVAGLVRIPSLPKFCEAWKETNAGRLVKEDSMQPFIEAQKARAKNYLDSIDNRVGIRVQDLYDIASGEVVMSWLAFENDKRRPFAICIIADIRGKRAEADKAIETIDKDLKAGGWTRQDVKHQGQSVRVYNSKPKPGQLKIEQVAVTLNDSQIIAADRDSVVTDLLDAVDGKPKGKAINTHPDFKHVLTQSARAIKGPLQQTGGTLAAEWYARPFQMGRILRESLDVDRGNQIDVLKLLENEGFDAIKAAGGIFAMAGKKYDLLHCGSVLAPPPFKKAARMLSFLNAPIEDVPDWVHSETASFNRLNLNIKDAFWASESLINEAFGDEIFRDIIDGIRDDEDGPQIDIENNVLPNLDNQVILLTDNTLPLEINSERMLVAIRVKNAAVVKNVIRKAMEVEPDVSKMEVALPGVEVWRMQRGAGDDDFDKEIFGDLELDFDEKDDTEEKPPLLDHWAIAVVDKGPGSNSPYLMFTSHPDFLIETAKRIINGAQNGLGASPEIKVVASSLKQLGAANPSFDRVVRTKLSLRAKYQLLRQGKLKDSDSVLASLARRFFEDEDGGQPDPLNAAKLPTLETIEKFLPAGGSFVESNKDGWLMTGFLLK
ncbi:MAG: membrane or secreted protein [Rubripirellula sp.]